MLTVVYSNKQRLSWPSLSFLLLGASLCIATASNGVLGEEEVMYTKLRRLQDASSDNGDMSSSPSASSPSSENGRDTYEFVAFLLWYLLLVVCCVLPTCCAYRRRRIVEARMTEQRTTFDQLRRQNFFVISDQQPLNEEEVKVERTKRITEELTSSTFTVKSSDISQISSSAETPTTEAEGSTSSSTSRVDEELGAVSLDEEAMANFLVKLPQEACNNGNNKNKNHDPKYVPGGCAICLGAYEEGDVVTWSPNQNCSHAFHRECIIPWLVKKSEPLCPCCRQEFCTVEAVNVESSHQRLRILTPPFGLLPTGAATTLSNQRTPQFFTIPNLRASNGVVASSNLRGSPLDGTMDAVSSSSHTSTDHPNRQLLFIRHGESNNPSRQNRSERQLELTRVEEEIDDDHVEREAEDLEVVDSVTSTHAEEERSDTNHQGD